MEECGAPTTATEKRYVGRVAIDEPGEKIGGSKVSEEGSNPGYANVKLGLLNVPYVDWTTLFLLGYLRQWDSYEDELTQTIVVPEFGGARPKATYQALRQMQKEGMIVSQLDAFDRGAYRRRYAITELGEAYLEYLANALAQDQKEVDLFFRLYDEQRALEVAGEARNLQGKKKGEKDACEL